MDHIVIMKFRNTMHLKLIIAAIILGPVPIVCSDNRTDSDSDLKTLRECTECISRRSSPKPQLLYVSCLNCFCDLDCIKYGDCCIDVLINNDLHTKQIDPGLNCVSSNSKDAIKLQTFNPSSSRRTEQFGYYMRNFYFKTGTTKMICDSRILPVSCGNGISYINMECALVNKATDCIHWSIESECTNDLNPKCGYYHVPPMFVELRQCDPRISLDIISTCKNNPEIWSSRCEKYFSLVSDEDGKVYRNIFCFKCNINKYGAILGVPINNPFISLTDFGDTFGKAVTPCDGRIAWMDMYANKCRPIQCYSEKILEDGYCLSLNRTALGNKYQLMVQLNISTSYPIPMIKQIVGNIMYWVSEEVYYMDYDVEVSVQVPKSTFSLVFLHVWLTVNHDIKIDDIEKMLTKVRLSWTTSVAVTTNVILHKLPYSEQTYMYLQLDQETGLCCTVEETLQVSHKSDYEPVTNELSCSYIEFGQPEFNVQVDAFIPHLNLSLSLESQEFSVVKDKLSVCFELFLFKTNLTRTNGTYHISKEQSSFDAILWYITIVCISLSMFSLVLVIITYIAFRALRTQPGINNLILSCNLLLAQFILMVGFDKTNQVALCKALGVIIHFFWLSMLFWMNICSYHMFKVFVFSKFVVRSSSGTVKQSIFYSIYGYGTPILIITTNIVANLIPTSGNQLGYGGNICYLSSKSLVLFSFVIPLCFVIVSNVIFFIWTIITIHRVKQEGKQTGERNNVYIYLKLSVVTGVFWTISLLSNFIDTIVLDYISVILNGSQGVFLLWSFVLNKSIWNKWKNKCGKSLTKDSSTRITNSRTKTSEI